ncbi:MAG: T9SS type A sorting domain-containing protein, partial [Flavobacteriales bacterium]|nr:T9SS type A sorting domain-containing protein [Flavobacteriales bacterium]
IFSASCTVGVRQNEVSKPVITFRNQTIFVKGKGTATIFNVLGKQLKQEVFNGSTTFTLNKSGVYLVRVQRDRDVVARKVYLN